jgi:hypothetical protein
MMTNLEIDEALASEVETAAKTRGVSTREFIRSALQQAIEAPFVPAKPAPYVQRVHDFGTHIESPWTILVDIESEEYVLKYSRK